MIFYRICYGKYVLLFRIIYKDDINVVLLKLKITYINSVKCKIAF